MGFAGGAVAAVEDQEPVCARRGQLALVSRSRTPALHARHVAAHCRAAHARTPGHAPGRCSVTAIMRSMQLKHTSQGQGGSPGAANVAPPLPKVYPQQLHGRPESSKEDGCAGARGEDKGASHAGSWAAVILDASVAQDLSDLRRRVPEHALVPQLARQQVSALRCGGG